MPLLRAKRTKREAEASRQYEQAREQAASEYAEAVAQYKAFEQQAIAAHKAEAEAWSAARREAAEGYAYERDILLTAVEAHNAAVREFRTGYETGATEAIERYALQVLGQSGYPRGIKGEPEVLFDEGSRTLVVGFRLPAPADVPRVTEYKYVARRNTYDPVRMKEKEFAAFYDDVIHQLALRVISDMFTGDVAGHIEAVVFNGWVESIDPRTGKPFICCILSVRALRDKFLNIDLDRVVPKECVRGLKGVTAGPLVMLAPVKPVMELNREDDRFVESKEVLDHLGTGDNLAAMEWEDFEHLVRELFAQEFAKTGGEVRVTQASRDRGVDAIAFDPDPIRGGKFVIQAKRYNMVVPVSAVRDLYGTILNEGAVKGILVTTSHFGRDSREFADGKPITLIDGANLVHLFQKHGRNVFISVLPKGDPRRGL